MALATRYRLGIDSDRSLALLLCPIAPSATGNGLAMRVGLFLRALSRRYRVMVVVVPLAGSLPIDPRSAALLALAERVVDIGLPDTAGYERSLRGSLLEPSDRRRVSQAGELPASVHTALPGRSKEILDLIREPVAVVHVMRLSLLPLGSSLARLWHAALTVDLDDDDVALAEAVGDSKAATQWSTVLRTWLADSAVATLANPTEVRSMRARWPNARFEVAPNAVDLSEPPSRFERPPVRKEHDRPTILIVANFTYRPNAEGLDWFTDDVLPRLGTPATCRIMGNMAPDVAAALRSRATRRRTELRVEGFVDHAELLQAYRDATVVVTPVLVGSGTRTKLLEAFAAERAVVTTTAAADGLDIVNGEHALVADAPGEFAAAIDRLLIDEPTGRRLAQAARRWVQRFDVARVAGEIGALLGSAADSVAPSNLTRVRS